MIKRKSSTALATTLAALLTVAPVWAQTGQTGTDTQTGTGQDQTDQTGSGTEAEGETDAEMPSVETPAVPDPTPEDLTQTQGEPGQAGTQSGVSTDESGTAQTEGTDGGTTGAGTGADSPTADSPSADSSAQAGSGQGGQGEMSGQPGQMMMLDLESFAGDIYERAFRQGYLRGVIESRERMMSDMARMRGQMQGEMQDRGQGGGMRQGGQMNQGGQPEGQGAEGSGGQSGGQMQGQMGQQGAEQGGERGSVIILPPGVTPQMFFEQLQRMGAQGN